MSQSNTVNGEAAIVTQNGRKKLIQKISFTGTGALFALSTTFPDGSFVESRALLCLQPDADCYVELTSAGSTAVTTHAGSRPGTRVLQYQQETQYNSAGDIKLDVIGASGGGNLSVFALTAA